jgi:hypothetical protein
MRGKEYHEKNCKLKASEILNDHGFETTVNDNFDIEVFNNRNDLVKIFYSPRKEKLTVKVRSGELDMFDMEEMSSQLKSAKNAFAKINEFAPELLFENN